MLLSCASYMAIVASRRSVLGVERCFDHVTAQTESLDPSELIIFSRTIRRNILQKRTDVRGSQHRNGFCQNAFIIVLFPYFYLTDILFSRAALGPKMTALRYDR